MIASPEHKDIFNRKHGKDYPRREYYYFTQKARKAQKYPLPQFISHRKAPYLYNLTQKARKSQKSFPITHWTVSGISAGLKAQHRIFL